MRLNCGVRHKNNTQKLPLEEGSIFLSCYEGASTFEIGSIAVTGDRAEVTIDLTYEEAGITVQWTDIALLVRRSGKWLLDDIRFDPVQRPGGTLSKRIRIQSHP
ncbi:MAG: hypothetical protein KDK99_02985 [Verrucomicrobiales bacterium]|nr:hypothetical protein [Verrucomicrobiales bacterium]